MNSFDPEWLKRNLDQLAWRHRTAFAAACCERLLPNYAAFAREEHWGEPHTLRAALDYIWSVLNGRAMDPDEVNRLIRQCDGVIPDTANSDASSVSAALDAGTAVIGTLRSLLDANTKDVVEVASYCRDTVHMYIQERDDLEYDDPLFETKIERDPLMRRELARQSAVLSELANNPVLDGELLKRLRDESADGGRSNIGRTAHELSS
jgi:uncharacterized protein YjaG (DUF416 family)